MPRSPLVKGNPGPFLVDERLVYDPATASTTRERLYEGTKSAIQFFGKVNTLNKKDSDTRFADGMGYARVREGVEKEATTVRYEIGVEVLEEEIWTHPDIKDEMAAFDLVAVDQLGTAQESYRKRAENAVSEDIDNAPDNATYPLFREVVRLLREGVTGWEKEYIVLRRYRRIPSNLDTGSNRASLNTTSLIYTTAELDLPDDVYFNVPDTDDLASSDGYTWGWRRRPSQVVYDGIYVEQSSEFVLAEWANLLYPLAGENSGW